MNRSRRGYSLVQVVAVMSIGTVVLGISVTVLHSLFRMSHALQQQVESDAALERFARRLRLDSQRAADFSIAPTPAAEGTTVTALELTIAPQERIVYRANEGEVVREQWLGGEAIHRDSFRTGGLAAEFRRETRLGNRVAIGEFRSAEEAGRPRVHARGATLVAGAGRAADIEEESP